MCMIKGTEDVEQIKMMFYSGIANGVASLTKVGGIAKGIL